MLPDDAKARKVAQLEKLQQMAVHDHYKPIPLEEKPQPWPLLGWAFQGGSYQMVNHDRSGDYQHLITMATLLIYMFVSRYKHWNTLPLWRWSTHPPAQLKELRLQTKSRLVRRLLPSLEIRWKSWKINPMYVPSEIFVQIQVFIISLGSSIQLWD